MYEMRGSHLSGRESCASKHPHIGFGTELASAVSCDRGWSTGAKNNPFFVPVCHVLGC